MERLWGSQFSVRLMRSDYGQAMAVHLQSSEAPRAQRGELHFKNLQVGFCYSINLGIEKVSQTIAH